jgi:hypothetical protein
MATYTWSDTNEYTSGTANEYKKTYDLWSIFTNYIRPNIPRYSTITKVTLSISAKQNLSLSSGSLTVYLSRDDGASSNEVIKESDAVKKDYKTFSADITSYFTLSGINCGYVSGKDENYLIQYIVILAHATVIRKHSIKNVTLKFEYNDQYNISTNVSPGGSGSVSGGGTKTAGTTITLTPNPVVGYKFTQWSDGSTSNPRNVMVTGNTTYTANFEKLKYTVSGTAETGGSVSGGGTYEHGSTATLTATPNDGYKFSHWLINGINSGITSTTLSETITENLIATAVFAVDKIYVGTSKPKSIYVGT